MIGSSRSAHSLQIIAWSVLLSLVVVLASACNRDVANGPSKEAIKAYNEAVLPATAEADRLPLLQKAIVADSNWYKPYFAQIEVAYKQNLFAEALAMSQRLAKIIPRDSTLILGQLARQSLLLGFDSIALQTIQAVLVAARNTDIADWSQLQEIAQFRVQAKGNTATMPWLDFLDICNTDSTSSYFPAPNLDGSEVLFTRRSKMAWTGPPRMGRDGKPIVPEQEDIYLATFSNRKILNISPVDELNKPRSNEGAATLSPDGQIMFITLCDREMSNSLCDLYVSYFDHATQSWSEPEEMSGVNTNASEKQPNWSAFSSTLFYSISKRSTIANGYDLYMARFSDSGSLVSIGPVKGVNSAFNETSPYIYPNDSILVFASDRPISMGGLDLYISRRVSIDSFSAPVNLGYPINTIADEFGFAMFSDGRTAAFSQSLSPLHNKVNIRAFGLPAALQAPSVSVVRLIIKPAVRPIPGTEFDVSMYDPQHGPANTFYHLSAYALDTTIIPLPYAQHTELFTYARGYMPVALGLYSTSQIDTLVYVEPTPVAPGAIVQFTGIQFSLDSDSLTSSSLRTIDRIAKFLKANPTVIVEVGGHTDKVGSDARNLKLSGLRAKAVVNQLISLGITPNRLQSKGYGSSKPVIKGSVSPLNRRTEIKIIR